MSWCLSYLHLGYAYQPMGVGWVAVAPKSPNKLASFSEANEEKLSSHRAGNHRCSRHYHLRRAFDMFFHFHSRSAPQVDECLPSLPERPQAYKTRQRRRASHTVATLILCGPHAAFWGSLRDSVSGEPQSFLPNICQPREEGLLCFLT